MWKPFFALGCWFAWFWLHVFFSVSQCRARGVPRWAHRNACKTTFGTRCAVAAIRDQRHVKTTLRSAVCLFIFFLKDPELQGASIVAPPWSFSTASSKRLAQPFISTRLDDNKPELLICVTVTEWRKLATLIKLAFIIDVASNWH